MALQASLTSTRQPNVRLQHRALFDRGWRLMVTSNAAPVADEDALRLIQQRLAFAFDLSGDALWSFNVAADHLALAGRWWSILGYEDREVEPTLRGWLGLVHRDDRARLLRSVIAHVSGRSASIEVEYRITVKSGDFVWTLARKRRHAPTYPACI